MMVPTLLVVSIIVFALIRAIPGDPAEIMLNDLDSDAAITAMRTELGLDRPLPVQYAIWLGNVLTGDLGTSIRTGQPVAEALFDRLGVTATITALAIGVAVLLAIPAGLIAAWKQDTLTDAAIIGVSILFLSLPSFWLGLMMIWLFAITLGWLPAIGFVSISEDFVGGLRYLIMPVATLALVEMAVVARMMRAQTLEVLRLDYVTHARAKGLPETIVLTRHVARNALGPAVTVIGLILGGLLGGASVTETVFSIPGIGRLLVDAIYARDYPVLQGCLLLIAFIYVCVNLLVDLAYAVLDPRVRL
ncbi:MAG: ABC transporter permease [Roseitalea sp.]|jgi:peptide/nickel transport system permease protein|nr:ABC transporter permease [Roseitalea sp.]MBO6721470.1 ABC transporter permease [Roseitalea sp.]MBO6742027.1 ABC transporter permease [Roseitalea sp.]